MKTAIKIIGVLLLLLVCFSPGTTYAQKSTSMEANKTVIREFYKAFNSEYAGEVENILGKTVISEWKSYGSNEQYRQGGSAAFLGILRNFHKTIPDLTWEIKEILEIGNRYIVRSKVTGTPKDIFLGVKPSGKAFEMMTIDIHTIENGKIVETYHVEDWFNATKQFAAQ